MASSFFSEQALERGQHYSSNRMTGLFKTIKNRNVGEMVGKIRPCRRTILPT
jgi:hypothetical protein